MRGRLAPVLLAVTCAAASDPASVPAPEPPAYAVDPAEIALHLERAYRPGPPARPSAP